MPKFVQNIFYTKHYFTLHNIDIEIDILNNGFIC